MGLTKKCIAFLSSDLWGNQLSGSIPLVLLERMRNGSLQLRYVDYNDLIFFVIFLWVKYLIFYYDTVTFEYSLFINKISLS